VTAWGVVGLLLALLFLSDAFRLRRRLSSLPVVPANEEAPRGDYVVWVHRSATFTPGAAAAVCAAAAEKGWSAVDVVPSGWSSFAAMAWAQAVDPAVDVGDRLAHGWSAGQALVVSRELLRRAGLPETAPTDALGFLRLARTLKQFAPLKFGYIASPGLAAAPLSPADRFAVFRESFLGLTPAVLAGQGALFWLTLACAWYGGWLGFTALVAFHLQPLIALGGGGVQASDVIPSALLAWPWQVWLWASAIARAPADPERAAAVAALRTAYASELAKPESGRFEVRAERCYVCGGQRLTPEIQVPDRLQHKPGRFVLERCQDCGHVFQNPRLSLEGLSYYYRDFYDGLGAAWLETIFRLSRREYRSRAEAYTGAPPRRWLDVGGGYGHFCLAARETWKDTRFECLDMSSSADDAVRRGWADAGHRGLLPDRSKSLAGQFDVVSLAHCMEHTRDPREELKAAREVLAPGGTLMIDVPDPDCVWRYFARGWWLPYFQPQHQHLLSVGNMSKLVQEAGFTELRVQRAQAHTSNDFFFAVFLVLDALAPEDLPWRSAAPPWAARWRAAVWAAGAPALLAGALLDGLIRQFLKVPGFSNAYRVMAKRP